LPDHPEDLPAARAEAPIVAPGPRAFWSEAIKAVISFITAQALIAVGLPVDDWAQAALAATGAEISSGQAWWIAASLLALGLYLMSRSLWRPAPKTPA
jgi:hypothetical protein